MVFYIIAGVLLFAAIVFSFGLRDLVRKSRGTDAYRILWLPAIAIVAALLFGSILVAPDYWFGILQLFVILGGLLVTLPSAVALLSLLIWYPYREGRATNVWFLGISLALAVVVAVAAYRMGEEAYMQMRRAPKMVEVPVPAEQIITRA
ncbi:MAG: hypothetical protein K8U03_08630 [Planctomycetia bacterium]|nr:hypothetical protein [Planctomycetia bacterium]